MLIGTFTHQFSAVRAVDAVSRRNNFRYSGEAAIQKLCPFAAHIRKTHPRDDISQEAVNKHRIMRHGIQFGCELSKDEQKSGKTQQDRGLIFVCYQSSIDNGFHFIQQCKFNLKECILENH